MQERKYNSLLGSPMNSIYVVTILVNTPGYSSNTGGGGCSVGSGNIPYVCWASR